MKGGGKARFVRGGAAGDKSAGALAMGMFNAPGVGAPDLKRLKEEKRRREAIARGEDPDLNAPASDTPLPTPDPVPNLPPIQTPILTPKPKLPLVPPNRSAPRPDDNGHSTLSAKTSLTPNVSPPTPASTLSSDPNMAPLRAKPPPPLAGVKSGKPPPPSGPPPPELLAKVDRPINKDITVAIL
jgi:hypothetical protein